MLKTIASMLIASLVAAGCGLVNSKTSGTSSITTVFTITDTTGHADTTFAVGQNVDLTFLLINTGSNTISYQTGGRIPLIGFEILKGDSVIGGNIYAMPAIITPPTKFLPGDTLRGECEAPIGLLATTPQHTLVHFVLSPGSYVAKADYIPITGATVTGSSSAGFMVHQ